MNGLFSSTPGKGPIRLITGSHGLLLIQSSLAWSLPMIPAHFRALIVLTGLVAIGSFVMAVIGENPDAHQPRWRRRDAR